MYNICKVWGSNPDHHKKRHKPLISYKTLFNFYIKYRPMKMLLFVSFGVLENIIVVC